MYALALLGTVVSVACAFGLPLSQLDSRFAIRAKNYKTLLDFMHSVASGLGFGNPDLRGIPD